MTGLILDDIPEPPAAPERWTLRKKFDFFVVMPFLVTVIIACGYFYYIGQLEYRAKVTAYCQPRGWEGGSAGKYGAFCIMRDGRSIQIPNEELR